MFVVDLYVDFMIASFFFFKQKTAYDMRISDWSSDVCSSDLRNVAQIFIAELIDQNDAIANESNAGLLAMRLVNQMRRTDRFPGTRRRDQQLCTMACANTGAKPIDALNLVGAQIHYAAPFPERRN